MFYVWQHYPSQKMAQQYGLSDRELEIIKVQHARRAANRREFLKQRLNPFKHAAEAGFVYDPAHQKFLAMQANRYPYFKPTVKGAIYNFGIIGGFMFVVGYAVWKQRSTREAQIRSGELKYRDRMFKLQ